MSSFFDYSQYYNLLYKDKDYSKEAHFIDSCIKKYNKNARSILDLGCGTGQHAKYLARRGYKVHGIDKSEQMLEIAKIAVKERNVSFSTGDIRNYVSNKTYDVITSLFDVISYQTTNNDLLKSFETAARHLEPSGIFIFDCWYGPGVLTDHPTPRLKRFEDNEFLITRFAEPVIYPNENTVNVKYDLFIQRKSDKTIQEIHEEHLMRYLFRPELELMLANSGFILKGFYENLTMNIPKVNSWKILVIAQFKR